jgi:hypothetical protein
MADAATLRVSAAIVDQLKGPGTPVADADRKAAAAILGVSIPKIVAVQTVESRGRGFRPDTGRPIILFEPHIFCRLTAGKFSDAWPEISYPVWGAHDYPSSQTSRWDMLAQAARLDEAAALKSASWGLFQVMGYNHKPAGYPDVQAFVRAMATTEGEQLAAFARFVKANPPMQQALQLSDWAGFARLYNGKGYAQHGYDQKLKAAYKAALGGQS